MAAAFPQELVEALPGVIEVDPGAARRKAEQAEQADQAEQQSGFPDGDGATEEKGIHGVRRGSAIQRRGTGDGEAAGATHVPRARNLNSRSGGAGPRELAPTRSDQARGRPASMGRP